MNHRFQFNHTTHTGFPLPLHCTIYSLDIILHKHAPIKYTAIKHEQLKYFIIMRVEAFKLSAILQLKRNIYHPKIIIVILKAHQSL